MPVYEVRKRTDTYNIIEVTANDNNQAKRMFCKMFNINPSDKWCGMSNMTARKIKD